MPKKLVLSPLRGGLRFGRRVDASVAELLASPELQTQVCEALDSHGLLLFRGQRLSPAEEEAFAKVFPWDDAVPVADHAGPYATVQATGVYGIGAGGPAVTPSDLTPRYGKAACQTVDRWKLPSHPMVQIQGHGRVQGHHGVDDGALTSSQPFAEWHTDGVHDTPVVTMPPAVTTMYCLETPKQGGETLFASGRAGFEALPEALKRRARGLTAVFDGRFRSMNAAGTRALPGEEAEGAACAVTNTWPLVALAYGAETLYAAAPSFTRHLLEGAFPPRALGAEESQQLLEELLTAALLLPEGCAQAV